MTLSGGQKARVNLARTIYRSDADIFLLDDPLSAPTLHLRQLLLYTVRVHIIIIAYEYGEVSRTYFTLL